MLIDRDDVPKRIFGIPELDVSEDLYAERLAGSWFRLRAVGLLVPVTTANACRMRLLGRASVAVLP